MSSPESRRDTMRMAYYTRVTTCVTDMIWSIWLFSSLNPCRVAFLLFLLLHIQAELGLSPFSATREHTILSVRLSPPSSQLAVKWRFIDSTESFSLTHWDDSGHICLIYYCCCHNCVQLNGYWEWHSAGSSDIWREKKTIRTRCSSSRGKMKYPGCTRSLKC